LFTFLDRANTANWIAQLLGKQQWQSCDNRRAEGEHGCRGGERDRPESPHRRLDHRLAWRVAGAGWCNW